MLQRLLAALSACILLSGALAASAAAEAANARLEPGEPSPGEALQLSTPLARDELIEAVLERNPGIAAARKAWEAALTRVPQARSLEDPTVSYSFAPQAAIGSDSPFGQVLSLGQKIPYPGTLRLRATVAEAEAAASEQRVAEVQLHLATMASQLYDDLWLSDRGLTIAQQHIDLLGTFQQVATSRYASGVAPQQAPIQAEVEAAHLLHRLTVLATARRAATARINALLHRPGAAPLPAPPLRLDAAREMPEDGTALASAAFASRPEVARSQAQVEARQAAVALEKLRLRPDFAPIASYNSMWRNPDHRLMVGVSMRVPLWRKGLKASVAEAEARLAEEESNLDELEDRVGAEVEIALAGLVEAHHVVRLYENRVLPAARDQITAARAAFETGASPMLDLIDAARSLLAAELSHLEAIAALSSTRAQLDRALGRLPAATSDLRSERKP